MRFPVLCSLLLLAAPRPIPAQLAAPAVNWQAATELPKVDLKGLSPAQAKTALKILREEGCTCQCDMKVAQCRVQDPNCSDSTALATLIVKSVREGKDAVAIRKAIAASPQARHAGPRGLLEDPVEISIAGAPFKGPKDARITLTEFSDFECPYCAKAVGQLDAILRAYPRDVKLVFKQFPIPSHPHARIASEAALAAFAQDKFWPMHDKMFANFRSISREHILTWAKESGLDVPKFTADLDPAKNRATIEKDVAAGEAAGVNGTPTIFVNGKRYNGSLDFENFKPVIEAELKK